MRKILAGWDGTLQEEQWISISTAKNLIRSTSVRQAAMYSTLALRGYSTGL
jgi:hypothetical protein